VLIGALFQCVSPLRAQEVGEAAKPQFTRRWVYLAPNLQVDEQLQKVQAIMRRAKAAGYNGVVLADFKLSVLHIVPPHYFKNLAAFKQTAQELGLQIFPAVCPVGYSNGLLAHDPNLAEGLPVRDAPFVVREGLANVEADASTRLQNADFEAAQNNKFSGFDFQDAIGTGSFVDHAVFHSGHASVRFENIGVANAPGGNGRVMQTVKVAPWRQYHLSVWLKTENFERPGSVRAQVLSVEGQPLYFPEWSVKRTQEWTQYHATFNSLGNDKVRIYFGVWGAGNGTLWWDDADLEDAGLNNLLRRAGCPLVVKSEDGVEYREGRDFEPVRDPLMGNVPWPGAYEYFHQPPALKLTSTSRISEGQRLRVSYYHAMLIHGEQVPCCLSDPQTFDIMKRQIEEVQKLLQPAGFLMSHDEIRVANWCETCRARNMTPGQLLADNAKRCIAMIRTANPRAEIWTWSDMFDPHHNAVDNYYLVNGSLAGSWEGVPADVGIANWNFEQRDKSLHWFEGRGHQQLIAGYYDGAPEDIKSWVLAAQGVRKVDGIMYTTWQNRYDDLEAFARNAWGK
jgi:hypothetical protein